MRSSDWSSDVCSSDLGGDGAGELFRKDDAVFGDRRALEIASDLLFFAVRVERGRDTSLDFARDERCFRHGPIHQIDIGKPFGQLQRGLETVGKPGRYAVAADEAVHHHLDIVLQLLVRSEEHTSELQSLMRISYAVFSLKNK